MLCLMSVHSVLRGTCGTRGGAISDMSKYSSTLLPVLRMSASLFSHVALALSVMRGAWKEGIQVTEWLKKTKRKAELVI